MTLEEFEKCDELYSDIAHEWIREAKHRKNFYFKAQLVLWSIYCIICLILYMYRSDEWFVFILVTGLIGIKMFETEYSMSHRSRLAIADFISRDWEPRSHSDSFEYKSNIFMEHAILQIIMNGYKSYVRQDGFDGLTPFTEKLEVLCRYLHGREKTPEPWIMEDGSLLTNPPFEVRHPRYFRLWE